MNVVSRQQIAIGLVVVLMLMAAVCATARSAQPNSVVEEKSTLVVAADPDNMPFSNAKLEGFENRLASLIAAELGMELRYMWHSQRRGFFRETLGRGKCQLVMGVPSDYPESATTRPYYRSSYVFISRCSIDSPLQSLQDPRLARMRVGVQVLGDGNLLPPANELIERGLGDNLVSYRLYAAATDERETHDQLVRAVGDGKVDAAIAWGPAVGYFVGRAKEDLALHAVSTSADSGALPYHFDIAIGVRPGLEVLRNDVDAILERRRTDIEQILTEFDVPFTRPDNVAKSSETEGQP
jgi:quinoprotein dehydrogenase-associated probable ABC transporter substrate-binding protein